MAAPPPVAEKPIDLFKAIFEDDSDSSDEEMEEENQQEAAEPPPAQVRSTLPVLLQPL